MIPEWCAALVRKTLSIRRLRQATRSPRPRGLLRLEGLEDRALLSTLLAEVPVPPATPSVLLSRPEAGAGQAGLERLLEDLRTPRLGTVVFTTLATTLAPNSVSGGEPQATGVGSSPPVTAPAESSPIPPPAPTDSPATDRPEPTTPPPSPSQAVTEPGGPSTLPTPRSIAPPEGSGVLQAPSPVPQGVSAGGAAALPAAPQPVSVADVIRPLQPAGSDVAARPLQGTPGPDTTETDGGGPRPPHGGATDPSGQPAAAGPGLGSLPDSVLVRRFAADREQAAFTELVHRHGRSVLAVCTRVLGDTHRAQDASQATFLALARRAGGLDAQGSLAGWLYKVAYRMALRCRTTAARQRRLDRVAAERPHDEDDTFAGIEVGDVLQALREELQRLPEKYRVPLVLCYLDGLTHAEVAQAVGLPRGSVAKRIGEGLDRLREGLAGRGFLL